MCLCLYFPPPIYCFPAWSFCFHTFFFVVIEFGKQNGERKGTCVRTDWSECELNLPFNVFRSIKLPPTPPSPFFFLSPLFYFEFVIMVLLPSSEAAAVEDFSLSLSFWCVTCACV